MFFWDVVCCVVKTIFYFSDKRTCGMTETNSSVQTYTSVVGLNKTVLTNTSSPKTRNKQKHDSKRSMKNSNTFNKNCWSTLNKHTQTKRERKGNTKQTINNIDFIVNAKFIQAHMNTLIEESNLAHIGSDEDIAIRKVISSKLLSNM